MKKKLLVGFVLVVLAFLSVRSIYNSSKKVEAASITWYVRSGATGNGSGSDWTNACKDFTGSCAVSSLVRGGTYYVAAGTYGSETWNTPVSGTSVITIKRATVADHGTDTGWSSTYDSRVIWGYDQDFTTGYWVFDGVSTTDPTSPTAYGFYVNHGSSCGSNQSVINTSATNVTFRYVAIQMCGPSYDTAQWCWQVMPGANNMTISHAYCSNSVDVVQTNGDKAQSNERICTWC